MTREPPSVEALLERGALPTAPGVRHTWRRLPTGVRMHVAEAGPPGGEPVLALHGWPQHWWMWRTLMPALAADGLRVICPDAAVRDGAARRPTVTTASSAWSRTSVPCSTC